MPDRNVAIGLVAITVIVLVLMSGKVGDSSFEFKAATVNPDEAPLFGLQFIDQPPSVVSPGEITTYRVRAVNIGQSGTRNVDSGLYPKEQIESWYGLSINRLFSLAPLSVVEGPNCVLKEENVQTKIVSLEHGQSEQLVFTVKAPSDPCKTYYVHVGMYENCWSPQHPEGYLSSRVAKTPVKLTTKCTTEPTDSGITGTPGTGEKCGSFDFACQGKGVTSWWAGLSTTARYVILGLGILTVILLFFGGGA